MFKCKVILLLTQLIVIFIVSACVHTVPLKDDSSKDIKQSLPRTKKIPAKVGLYLTNDVKNYIYKKQKMGMTFQMNIGDNVVPISKEIVSAMFEEVIYVDSLPPYKQNSRPDVEAVVVPDILYCYGNAIGTISGHIEANVKIRVRAYDLSGKVIWHGEAMGESQSKEVNFVNTLFAGMGIVGETGYKAAFTAATKIINDFNAKRPKEFYSLLEIKKIATLKNRKNISNYELFQKYYQKGVFQFDEKNYHQSLYSLEKAENIYPDDPSTNFYIGVCNIYLGYKNIALTKFKQVIKINPQSQEANDSNKWIEKLKEPLKISMVNKNMDEGLFRMPLLESQMYDLININDIKPIVASQSKGFDQFMDKCSNKGVRVVVYVNVDESSQQIKIDGMPVGDIATEHVVKIEANAYSTKKKDKILEFHITELTSTIRKISKDEESAVIQELLRNGAEKIVLRLLENNIF